MPSMSRLKSPLIMPAPKKGILKRATSQASSPRVMKVVRHSSIHTTILYEKAQPPHTDSPKKETKKERALAKALRSDDGKAAGIDDLLQKSKISKANIEKYTRSLAGLNSQKLNPASVVEKDSNLEVVIERRKIKHKPKPTSSERKAKAAASGEEKAFDPLGPQEFHRKSYLQNWQPRPVSSSAVKFITPKPEPPPFEIKRKLSKPGKSRISPLMKEDKPKTATKESTSQFGNLIAQCKKLNRISKQTQFILSRSYLETPHKSPPKVCDQPKIFRKASSLCKSYSLLKVPRDLPKNVVKFLGPETSLNPLKDEVEGAESKTSKKSCTKSKEPKQHRPNSQNAFWNELSEEARADRESYLKFLRDKGRLEGKRAHEARTKGY